MHPIEKEEVGYQMMLFRETKPDFSEGVKYDGGKVMLELLPMDALIEVAKTFTYGAHKYEEENWRKGLKWKRIYGALLRHLFAWMTGENEDPETGISHLAHAGFGILVLLNYTKTHPEMDDRVKY